ncbi:MAG: peptidoglycan-binding protein [Clostridiales bacterium]|nr:peptidoglycan-binding protein [Clostridiales bacterium]
MSSIDLARRTELTVKINNADISDDVNEHLISMTYTDEEDGTSDDVEITMEDRDNTIVGSWLTTQVEGTTTTTLASVKLGCPYQKPTGTLKKGSSGTGVKWLQWMMNKTSATGLTVNGSFGASTETALKKYQTYNGVTSNGTAATDTYTALEKSAVIRLTCPYTQPTKTLKYGQKNTAVKWLEWCINKSIGTSIAVDGLYKNETKNAVKKFQKKYGLSQSGTANATTIVKVRDAVYKALGGSTTITTTVAAKRASMTVSIVQKNWASDGKDITLNCGTFEMDEVQMKGPPQTVTLRGTALSYSSSTRTTKRTQAWENTTLLAIAKSIAKRGGYSVLYLSDTTVKYTRKEQSNQTDIVFLQKLCTAAGLSLKVTDGTLVIFDQKTYEAKTTVRTIKRGDGSYSSYNFKTSLSDTAYSACHVSYDDTDTGKTIEYTYVPSGSTYDEDNVLEVTNEKVSTTAEAKALAIAKLRAANKGETEGSFTMAGDMSLVAGLTVQVTDYGAYDGKYIIERSVHKVSSTGGYTTSITLRQVITSY